MSNPTIESNVKGIPCIIEVTYLDHTPPSWKHPSQCDNPWEYYGGFEVEFTVRDRKGYAAEWLERKLDGKETERIEEEIYNAYQKGEI